MRRGTCPGPGTGSRPWAAGSAAAARRLGIRHEGVDRLVLVRRERADVDQGRHVRVSAGFADDRAAVGVSDEHDRAVLRVDDHPRGGGVARQRQGGVLHHGDAVAILGEQVVDRPPPRAVHEASVDEDHVFDRIGHDLLLRLGNELTARSACGRSIRPGEVSQHQGNPSTEGEWDPRSDVSVRG